MWYLLTIAKADVLGAKTPIWEEFGTRFGTTAEDFEGIGGIFLL